MDSLSFWLQPALLWFLIGLMLMIVEFMSPGIVILFFALGAWIVSLVSLFIDISLTAQLTIFLVCSVLMLVTLRKWLRGFLMVRFTSFAGRGNDLEEFVGKRATVKSAITPTTKGKVSFHGTLWGAQSDVEIPEGASVQIMATDSITLIVKPLE